MHDSNRESLKLLMFKVVVDLDYVVPLVWGATVGRVQMSAE